MNLSKSPRAEQWAGRISAQMGKSVESIVEVGRLLVKAKSDLPHGEWGRLFDDGLVPFSQQSANKLMAVATHALLSNSAHGRSLPPSWRTLYELTRVPEPTLKNALKDGVITPDMPRKAVAELLPPNASKPRQANPANEPEPFDSEIVIARLMHFIRGVLADWPKDHPLKEFIYALDHEARYAEEVEKRRTA